MRKAFIYLALVLVTAVVPSCGGRDVENTSPVRSFLQPLQERDSVLIADQLLFHRSLWEQRITDHGLPFVLAREDNCNEEAIFAVNGDHAVRGGAIIVDAVSLTQILDVIADLDLEPSLHDHIELLSGVLGQVNGLML